MFWGQEKNDNISKIDIKLFWESDNNILDEGR